MQEPLEVSGMLATHNRLRAAEGVGLQDLYWDPALAFSAQQKADYLAHYNNCHLDHHAGPLFPDLGENLFWCSNPRFDPAAVVQSWYDEKPFYHLASNTCQDGEMCGHYTQIVWRGTQRMGAAAAFCPRGGGVVFVCHYDPPGNWVGQRPY